jgi:hypothetical protein
MHRTDLSCNDLDVIVIDEARDWGGDFNRRWGRSR